jgi:hypothetical protein
MRSRIPRLGHDEGLKRLLQETTGRESEVDGQNVVRLIIGGGA